MVFSIEMAGKNIKKTNSLPGNKNKQNSKKKDKTDFFDKIQFLTEEILTNRKRKKRLKKEKLKKKNIILDWVETFLWAVGMVLLINQYIIQAYQIPSGSMIDTLLIGDHIFVNKFIYGPELLPGLGKLPSPIRPERNDIIIFENPNYVGRGTVFNILQRVIYMLTLARVDIDRDEFGNPRPHFLIKRAVGVEGDRIVYENGNILIRPRGESIWYDENTFFSMQGMNHNIIRLMDLSAYPAFSAAGKAMAFNELRLPIPSHIQSLQLQASRVPYPDFTARDEARLIVLRGAYPHESRYSISLARMNLGTYVPESRILPLGDNRDNSLDGRSFGSVSLSRVLGKGLIIYWPGDFRTRRFQAFERFGGIK